MEQPKKVIDEPQKCEECGGQEPMDRTTASVDGKAAEGWLCWDCGHFHY